MDLIDEENPPLPPLHDLRVCLSGNGQGEIAAAIKEQLTVLGAQFVDDNPIDSMMQEQVAHVAICTTGKMLIGDPSSMPKNVIDRLYESNYRLPRLFTERHIYAMRRDKVEGLVIHLGSNASYYGNVGAEDYAAFKSALRKYLELRGREVRDDGIRISHLAFGGVSTKFWDKATAGVSDKWTKSIVPGARQPLTAEEAAAVVVATIMLPANVTMRDALIVSRDYQ